MEIYSKPSVLNAASIHGLIPLAAAGAALAEGVAAIASLSAAKAAVVGVAAGLAVGRAKGVNSIDSFHTGTLTARKDFALG